MKLHVHALCDEKICSLQSSDQVKLKGHDLSCFGIETRSNLQLEYSVQAVNESRLSYHIHC